jgi:hypothetical protein
MKNIAQSLATRNDRRGRALIAAAVVFYLNQ